MDIDEDTLFRGLIILGATAMFSFLGYLGYKAHQWNSIPPTEHECRLISGSFTPSTAETHVVPVVTTKGMGMGIATSGNTESRMTFWDCEGVGRVMTKNREVYRFAKDFSTLILRVGQVDVEVLGIKHE